MSQNQHDKSPEKSGLSYNEQSIAALASGPGGAIAVIRVSGPQVFAELRDILDVDKLVKGPRQLFLQPVHNTTGEILDHVLAVAFLGPHSFTGEDTVEIMCHGGPFIVRTLLDVLYTKGVRAAEPGEFTRRAFLNGKLDLTAAEGIKELVAAESEGEWLAAKQLSDGRLQQTILDLRTKLIKALAYLEASIDFPDEGDTAHVHKGMARDLVEAVREQLSKLISEYESGRVTAQGLRLSLIGPANAGKSTLMNYFLDKERAIVTDIPGTTRDYLEERCLIRGRLVTLVDTAGLRETTDVVEAKGVASSRQLMTEADLCLLLVPSDMTTQELAALEAEVQQNPPQHSLWLGTKIDLGSHPYRDKMDHLISCQSGEGMDALYARIADFIDQHINRVRGQPFLVNSRQKNLAAHALQGLQAFFTLYDEDQYEECLAFELQQVVASLEAITGKIDSEDVLDKVFSEFCVGK